MANTDSGDASHATATLEAVLLAAASPGGVEWPSLGTATFVVYELARALAAAPSDPTPSRSATLRAPLAPGSVTLDASGAVRLLPREADAPTVSSLPTAATASTRAIAYLSPEGVDNVGVDGASDVFSLGSIFFELLARRPPFRRETDLATLHAIQHDDIPPLPTHVPAELGGWAIRCLARAKSERPDAAELAGALGLIIESLPTARPSRVADLVRRTFEASRVSLPRPVEGAAADTALTGKKPVRRAPSAPTRSTPGSTPGDASGDGRERPRPSSRADGAREWPVWAEKRFEVIGKLGSGGMGEVYRVLDRELDEVVAMKLVPQESTSELRSTERLRREVRLARKISSPHVCRIYDIIDLGGGVRGLTMALVEGTTLAELMRLGVHVDYARFARWGADIADGLAAAHEIAIVHRDLKPENVIIRPDDRAVILDFGIALSADGTTASVKLTQQGMIMGTPLYMSPEQLCNVTLDGRSDLFALGLILAELITGDVPMRGTSYAELVERRVTRANPYVLMDIDPGTPREISEIIDELLRTTVTLRARDGREVAARLRAAAQDGERRALTRQEPGNDREAHPSPDPNARAPAVEAAQPSTSRSASPPPAGEPATSPAPRSSTSSPSSPPPAGPGVAASSPRAAPTATATATATQAATTKTRADRRWFAVTTLALVAATIVLIVVSAVFGGRRLALDREPSAENPLSPGMGRIDSTDPGGSATSTRARAPSGTRSAAPRFTSEPESDARSTSDDSASRPRRREPAPRARELPPAEPM